MNAPLSLDTRYPWLEWDIQASEDSGMQGDGYWNSLKMWQILWMINTVNKNMLLITKMKGKCHAKNGDFPPKTPPKIVFLYKCWILSRASDIIIEVTHGLFSLSKFWKKSEGLLKTVNILWMHIWTTSYNFSSIYIQLETKVNAYFDL